MVGEGVEREKEREFKKMVRRVVDMAAEKVEGKYLFGGC